MAGNYIKSLMWLVGCSSVGYGLYLICMASESQAVATNKLQVAQKSNLDSLKKNEQIIAVLQSAATTNVPIYRLKKEDIEKTIRSE